MTDFLVLDIETIPDPELPPAPPVEGELERLPSPPHHQIVTIGALRMNELYEIQRVGIVGEGKGEAGILRDFASVLEKQRPQFVTFNGRGFDLPVIAARCLRHGVPLGTYYRARDYRYRYTADGHLDIMDYVSDFGASKPTKLDVIAKLCGMPGKVGVTGSDVAGMVAAGKLEEVQRYCLCDVVQTAAVFLRVQLLRGDFNRPTYVAAAERLVAMIQEDARLEAVAKGMNVERILLRESETNNRS